MLYSFISGDPLGVALISLRIACFISRSSLCTVSRNSWIFATAHPIQQPQQQNNIRSNWGLTGRHNYSHEYMIDTMNRTQRIRKLRDLHRHVPNETFAADMGLLNRPAGLWHSLSKSWKESLVHDEGEGRYPMRAIVAACTSATATNYSTRTR